jgi:hypothetical protein
MKILLDENFPLALVPTLRENGYEAEHIILLQLRGTSDITIAHRLNNEDLLFLTEDQDFLELPLSKAVKILLSGLEGKAFRSVRRRGVNCLGDSSATSLTTLRSEVIQGQNSNATHQ